MVAHISKANNAEWPLRRIKMKAARKAEEKNSLDNTILALKRTPVKSQNKVDLRAVFLDLEKTFEETKALFEETDERVQSMRSSSFTEGAEAGRTSGELGNYPGISLQEMPALEEENSTEDEDGFQEESSASAKSEPENRRSWDSYDPTVPQGWKTKICPNGGGKMQKKFLDPVGKVSDTRKQAWQRMLEDPMYSEEDILLMKSHMNNKMEKVFRRVVDDEKEGLNKMQEAVDELKEIEAKVMIP